MAEFLPTAPLLSELEEACQPSTSFHSTLQPTLTPASSLNQPPLAKVTSPYLPSPAKSVPSTYQYSNSTSLPSSTFSPGKFETPSATIELTMSARNLLNLDSISKSDPVCILYILDLNSREWVEYNRTECIHNDLNPNWSTKFTLDYKFEERQMLLFKVYDWDGKAKSLDTHDFLGQMECALGEIVSSPHGKLSRRLILPSAFRGRQESSLTVVAEEIDESKYVLTIKICSRIDEKRRSALPSTQKTIPFLVISKQLDDGSWTLIHSTNRIDEPFSLRLSSITSRGNLERQLRWQMYLQPLNVKMKSAKLIGEFTTNYLDLQEKYRKRQAIFTLWNSKSQKQDGQAGKVEVVHLVEEQQITFLDHIKNGLELSISIAIDFTASNGDPDRHTSLHYRHGGQDNPYVLSIKAVGEILQDYNKDKRFAAFGFGAKGFPAGNTVSHNFPINLKQSDPYCDGIDGVLTAYNRIFKRIKLFGPTCFSPIIKEQAKIARENQCGLKYFVLLILTDGSICDPDTTREAIVAASQLPMSIIIIGIGDEDFTEMEQLDSDSKLLSFGGKTAKRDIVQFVEIRKFINFKSINPITSSKKRALTQAVLAELPNQVNEWMRHMRMYNQ